MTDSRPLVEQPTRKPTRKVGRGFGAVFLSGALIHGGNALAQQYLGSDLPPEMLSMIDFVADDMALYISGVVGGLVAYFTKERAPRLVVVSTHPEPEV